MPSTRRPRKSTKKNFTFFPPNEVEGTEGEALRRGARAFYVDGRSSGGSAYRSFIEETGEWNPDEEPEEGVEYRKDKGIGTKGENDADGSDGNKRPTDNSTATPSKPSSSQSNTSAKFPSSNSHTPPNPDNMSFRGGRGGGRGGGLKGATWEYDPDVKLEAKPSELFPPHPNLKRPEPLTDKEKRQVKNYKTLQEEIHRGPLYTEPTKRDPDAAAKTFSEDQFNSQYGKKGKSEVDPFNGVETYSMKYAPKKRTIPQLSARPFNKALFPAELHEVLEGAEGEKTRQHINRIVEKKALMLGGGKDMDEKTRVILEKIKNATGGGEEDAELEEPDEEAEAEEEDYDFEDDENEMGGDYDGEKYFDNGEGESDDNAEGGNDDY